MDNDRNEPAGYGTQEGEDCIYQLFDLIPLLALTREPTDDVD